jgi:hypothetical protein
MYIQEMQIMSRKLRVPKPLERDRRKSLEQFLTALDRHPELAPFRTMVRSGRGAATGALGGYEQSAILRECALLTREEIRCYQRLQRLAKTRDLLL